MDIPYLSRFVSQCAIDANTKFTLDGEGISSKDLGDEHALLPLIVATINTVHEQISGTRSSHLTYLEPANPDTHVLGWRVKALPDFPQSAMLLYANHAIREHLTLAPAPRLPNPTASKPAPTPGQASELRGHLTALGLAPASSEQSKHSSPIL